jgi:hypothetical protein
LRAWAGRTQGRFKVPLLRGEVNPSVDRWSTLQTQLQTDLDSWVANLYV